MFSSHALSLSLCLCRCCPIVFETSPISSSECVWAGRVGAGKHHWWVTVSSQLLPLNFVTKSEKNENKNLNWNQRGTKLDLFYFFYFFYSPGNKNSLSSNMWTFRCHALSSCYMHIGGVNTLKAVCSTNIKHQRKNLLFYLFYLLIFYLILQAVLALRHL